MEQQPLLSHSSLLKLEQRFALAVSLDKAMLSELCVGEAGWPAAVQAAADGQPVLPLMLLNGQIQLPQPFGEFSVLFDLSGEAMLGISSLNAWAPFALPSVDG